MKKVALLGVLFGIVVGMGSSIYAYDGTKSFNATDISTWNQFGGAFPENATLRLANGTGGSISEYGSDYYSIASMLVKCGEMNPYSGKSPVDLIKKANSRGLWKDNYGNFDVERIEELWDGVSLVESYVDLSGLSTEDALLVIKGKFYEGYLIQVCLSVEGYSNGNYIFVDGYENDEMVYTDSAFVGTRWSDFYGKNNTKIKYINIFESEYGLESYKIGSVYEMVEPTGKDNDDETEESTSSDTGNTSSSSSIGSVQTTKSPEEFLNILKGYSDRVKSDKDRSILWVYSTVGSESTFEKETNKAERGVTAEINGVQKEGIKRGLINEYVIINWALVDLGIIDESQVGTKPDGKGVSWASGAESKVKEYCEIKEYSDGKNAKDLGSDLEKGDICFFEDYVAVYAGNDLWYDAGKNAKGSLGKLYTDLNESDYVGKKKKTFIYNSLEPVESVGMEEKIYTLIRIKKTSGVQSGSSELVRYNTITSEWDLKGMPKYVGITGEQSGIVMSGYLTTAEEKNLEAIKYSGETNEEKVARYVRGVIALVGLLLMIYGILVGVAYLFDRSNNFIDISMLGLISLGRWGYSDEWKGQEGTRVNGVLFLSKMMLIRRVIVAEVVGLVLTTGVVYGFIKDIISFVSDLL